MSTNLDEVGRERNLKCNMFKRSQIWLIDILQNQQLVKYVSLTYIATTFIIYTQQFTLI